MLLFYGKSAQGLPADENACRAARLKALRTHFYALKRWKDFEPTKGDAQTHPLQMALNEGRTLADLYGDRSVLVLNAHGNANTFNGLTGQQVADNLNALGIQAAGTREVWVAACSVGAQQQDNRHSPMPLVKQLLFHLRQLLPDDKVYGPRGILCYGDRRTVDVGQGQKVIEYGAFTSERSCRKGNQ